MDGERCRRCGAPAVVEARQAVVGDRLAWSVSVRCPACGEAEEEDGWDEMPAGARELVVRRTGLVTLRAEPAAGRARLLAVFRRGGATLGDAAAAYRALTTDGIAGTPAEMRLLAGRLEAAGAVVAVTPAGAPGGDAPPGG